MLIEIHKKKTQLKDWPFFEASHPTDTLVFPDSYHSHSDSEKGCNLVRNTAS